MYYHLIHFTGIPKGMPKKSREFAVRQAAGPAMATGKHTLGEGFDREATGQYSGFNTERYSTPAGLMVKIYLSDSHNC